MIFKNALAYPGAHLLSQAFIFGQNFVVRRLLPPQVMGIWNYVNVVQGFVSTFDLGITTAAFMELPQLRGRGEIEEEIKARATAFWSNLGMALLMASGILIYLVVCWWQLEMKLPLLVAAALVILSTLTDPLTTFQQGAQQYLPLSRITVLIGMLQAVLLCLGAYVSGIYGLMYAAVVVQVINVIMLYKSCIVSGQVIKFVWDWRIFKRQIGFGLPFRLVDYPMSLFFMVDILFITKFMSMEALAIYTTARMVFSSAMGILGRMGQVILPRLIEGSTTPEGRRQGAAELRNFLLLEYLVLMPLIICLTFFGTSLLIAQLIPKYFDSIPLLQIMFCSLYFVPQTTLVRNYWLIDKRLVSLGISNVVGLSGLALLMFILIRFGGMNLQSVAWATVGGSIIYYLYIMASIGVEVWGKAAALGLCSAALISAAMVGFIMSGLSIEVLQADFTRAVEGSLTGLIKGLLLLSPLMGLGGWLALKSRTFNLDTLR